MHTPLLVDMSEGSCLRSHDFTKKSYRCYRGVLGGEDCVGDDDGGGGDGHASWLFHIDRAEPIAMCMSRYW